MVMEYLKLLFKNSTWLFNAAVIAAVITAVPTGIIGFFKIIADIINGRKDRSNRVEIKDKEIEAAKEIKQLELETAKEIKEIEVKANKEIKQMELRDKIRFNLLDDLIKCVASLYDEICFYDGYDYVKRATSTDYDITKLGNIIKNLLVKIEQSNPFASELIEKLQELGNKASILSSLKNSELDKFGREKIKFEDAGRAFNAVYREYLSHYYD